MPSDRPERGARIVVVGVGGGGGNAVNRMIEAQLSSVKFVAVNTDLQVLERCLCDNRLQIGASVTRGLGAGGDAVLAEKAAEESRDEIAKTLEGNDMVFVTAGMGGGTGTGACPVVAEVAREQLNALTVGVITRPFTFEGGKRAQVAEGGIRRLREVVDTLIVIPNDKLLTVSEKTTPILEAFRLADEVLRQGIQGISDLIVVPGIINLDFADVRAVMTNAGTALMGVGQGSGEGRAVQAAQSAISSPLLEMPIDGATSLIVNITGPQNLALHEANEAVNTVVRATSTEAPNVLLGVAVDPRMDDQVMVTVIATGFGPAAQARTPAQQARATARPPMPAFTPPHLAGGEPEFRPLLETLPKGLEEEPELPAFLRRAEGFDREKR